MPKKIVLLSDGTGNSAAKARKTNVWRLYQALDQTRSDQVAFYDDGVGTSSNKYLAMLGGAFGWGLKRNVLDLYKFACRNYEPGAEIYGFGFSRGAFTIRTLVGLITNEGLVTFRSEEELSRNAVAAYRHYRSTRFPSWSPLVLALRWLRDKVLWAKDRLKGYPTYDQLAAETGRAGRKGIRIKFLGLWDTVEAYGVPIPELKRGIDWVLWPMMFGDLKLSPLVDRACQALSLDDERATFHPLAWDETAEAGMVQAKTVRQGRITQVWFAGAHSNVGGGYADDQLSLVSLEWIMAEAMASGLVLDRDAVKQISATKSPFGKRYNSRAGFAAYYRYSPRSVPVPTHKGTEIRPIIHNSVIFRMASGSDSYAPISLPRRFWVLASDGKLLPMEGFDEQLKLDVTKRRAAGAAIVSDKKAEKDKGVSDLQAAMRRFKPPAQDAISLVWDTVWWRRALYFLTVLLTATLVLYPWLQGLYAKAVRSLTGWVPIVGDKLEQANTGARGFVSDLVDAATGFIPSYGQPWADALREHPVEFVSILLAILLSLYASNWLDTRIRDRARLAWHEDHRAEYLAWLGRNQSGWRMGTLIALCVVLALFGGAYWLSWAESTRVLLAFTAGVLAILLIWRMSEMAKFGRPGTQQVPATIPNTFGLSLARRLRKNRYLVSASDWTFQRAVPIGFAVAILILGTLLANRIIFDAASAAGAFCHGAETNKTPLTKVDGEMTVEGFPTTSLCWPTGIGLEKGQRYRIELEVRDAWFDRTIPTDVGGYPSNDLLHYLGTPLRRWWGRNWFQPIARIGELGNDEFVLEAVVPLRPHVYCTDPAKYGGQKAAASSQVIRSDNPQSGESRCHEFEDSEMQQSCACKQCLKQAPEPEPPYGISPKITAASAAELARCSPTPTGRRKLKADIEARTSGELFIYVNDAVAMLPGMSSLFFRNNSGTGVLRVNHLESEQSLQ